jgi:hypothetical protein
MKDKTLNAFKWIGGSARRAVSRINSKKVINGDFSETTEH